MPAAKKTPSAVAEQTAEATNTPTTFEYAGFTYTVPPFKKLPLAVLEAEDDLTFVRRMIGDEQWATFRATDPTIADFETFSALVTSQGN